MWSIGVLTGTTSYKGQFRSVRSCRTFEPAMLKGHGTMDNAREHHAGRAARTARALDGCEGCRRKNKLVARHFPAFGRERAALSVTDRCLCVGGDRTSMRLRVPG